MSPCDKPSSRGPLAGIAFGNEIDIADAALAELQKAGLISPAPLGGWYLHLALEGGETSWVSAL